MPSVCRAFRHGTWRTGSWRVCPGGHCWSGWNGSRIAWSRTGRKVFKLRAGVLGHDGRLNLARQHRLKGNATTFTLHPGPHRIAVQVNGTIRAEAGFILVSHR